MDSQNVNYSLRFTRYPRGLLFVGATWLRPNASTTRATSVASLITSSKLRSVRCAFLGRISAQIRSPSSSIAALAALAAPAHRAAIESRIAPRSARPAPSNLRTSAAMGSSSATSRATPSALCRRHSNLSVSSSTCIRTSEPALAIGDLSHQRVPARLGIAHERVGARLRVRDDARRFFLGRLHDRPIDRAAHLVDIGGLIGVDPQRTGLVPSSISGLYPRCCSR